MDVKLIEFSIIKRASASFWMEIFECQKNLNSRSHSSTGRLLTVAPRKYLFKLLLNPLNYL
jgi:hypothetical protein